jgi:hypothetical protein
LPTLLEYGSFIHIATGCIIGPYMEYMDFKNWIEFAGPYASLPRGGLTTLVPAVTRLGHGVLCLALHLAGALGLGLDVYFCGRPEFQEYGNIVSRHIYYNAAMTF